MDAGPDGGGGDGGDAGVGGAALVPVAAAGAEAALDGLVIRAEGRPAGRGGGAEEADGGHAEAGGEVEGRGVGRDEEAGAGEDGKKMGEGEVGGESGGFGEGAAEFGEVSLFAGGRAGGEDDGQASGMGEEKEFDPVGEGPFLFGLAGGEVEEEGMAGENFFGRGGEGGVGAGFEAGFGGEGDVPGAEDLKVMNYLVAGGVGLLDAPGVGEAADEVAVLGDDAEALGGADESAEDGAAVIADEVDAAVEALAAEGADDGQAGGEADLAAGAGEGPDAVDPGEVLDDGGGVLGDEQMELGFGPVGAQGAQRRHDHGNIAQEFEFDGQDFCLGHRGTNMVKRWEHSKHRPG